MKKPIRRALQASVYKKIYRDQEGIFRRYLREKAHWDVHLDNTRKYLLNHLTGRNATTLALLGSGWLLDVPVNELTRRYRMIYLIDLRHPAQVLKKYQSHNRLTFITADITGGAADAIEQVLRGKTTVQDINFNAENLLNALPETPDEWASVNTLNQLDILLVNQLEQQGGHSTEELFDLRRRIQSNHLQFLSKRKSVLITDYKEQQLNDKGIVEAEKPLVHTSIPEGKAHSEWLWMFDTQKTYHRKRQTQFKVIARCFNLLYG